jgi:hypothetical protein
MQARQSKAIFCVLSTGGRVLLPHVLFNRVTAGDDVTFPIPTSDAAGTEVIDNGAFRDTDLSLPGVYRIRHPAKIGQT